MSYYNQQQQPPPVGVPPPQGSFSLSVHLALYINWIWVSIFNFFSSIGYKPEGYGKEGYPPPGYPPPGYPPPGYLPQQGYPPPPYPAQGYPPPYAPQYAQPPPRQQNSTGPGCLEGWCVPLSLSNSLFQIRSDSLHSLLVLGDFVTRAPTRFIILSPCPL